MRLFNSTASFSAALAASQAILHIKSTAAVASIVDLAYETESQKQSANESHQSNEECSFVSSFNLRKADADLGILSQCSAPAHVCVEDASSTLGGRCVPVMSRERKLQTTCETKCTPASACEGLSQDFIDNKIGQGSCCGEEACVGVSESSVIGEKSCIGNKNCFGMVDMTVGNNSCNGDSVKGYDGYYGYACAFAKGEVGSDSCFEYASCYQSQAERDDYSWNVGNNSCRGQDACKYSTIASIAGYSCNGEYACTRMEDYTTEVGTESCVGSHACYKNSDNISDASCNGFYGCYQNSAEIGRDSCNGKLSCENNSGVIGDSLCNGDYECRNNANPVTIAPTAAPTAAPSKSDATSPPSSSPSKAPTSASPTVSPVTAAPTKPDETSPPTASPTKAPTKNPTNAPSKNPTKNPTASPTAAPVTAAPTKAGATSAPTKKPVETPSPTKTPTKAPASSAPTQKPVTISPTLLLSVDLCYPGCGDFTDIYTNNEFEDMIMKYTPCTAADCTVTILSASDSCTPCAVPGRRLRFLEDSGDQSSAITFEIVSDTPLNEDVVLGNLNDGIEDANEDLSQDGITFSISGNYQSATLMPTSQPTKKPTASSSKSGKSRMPVSSKSEKQGKSSKSHRSGKSSKSEGTDSPPGHAGKSGKSEGTDSPSGNVGKSVNEKKQKKKEELKQNKKKQEMKKLRKEMMKKEETED